MTDAERIAGITEHDRALNNWAFRSFRDIADADYINARLACRAQLAQQFLWGTQQAIEKYLKCALFIRRISATSLGHDLAPGVQLLLDAGVGFELSDGSTDFIKKIDQMGQFRYMEVSHWVDWHWIVALDKVVWEVRRFSTLDPAATRVKLIDPKWPPRVRIVGGHLERILAKRDNPAREPLLWQNAFFGRRRRAITVRGGITAVNSPLFRNALLLDEILKYAHIPKYVVKAYREHAAKSPDGAKKL